MAMITDIEQYFTDGCGRCKRFATADCSTRQWNSGLAKLRQICLRLGLVETVKWGHPCYMHANRNIVIIGALRNDFRLSFFNAALMKDPEGVLEKQGMVSFAEHLTKEDTDAIRAYVIQQAWLAVANGDASAPGGN